MANVFISHRLDDTRIAEQLAIEIRNAGHQVWLDEWVISLGDSIIERMNQGLTGATYVVVCYSPLGVTSQWIGREWMSSLAQQLNGKNIKLLPVVLTGGEPPPILADLKYADLTRDWADGVRQLLKAIR